VEFLIDNAWRFLLMAGLLLCSGFFSASETAFFHLSPRKISGFAHSTHHLERLIHQLLQNPNRLLTSLLFGNMVVNVLFFSIAGVLTVGIQRLHHPIFAGLWAVATFVTLVLFGEMLPKALAYANTYSTCKIAAIPLYFLRKLLNPLLVAVETVIVKPAVRLSIPPGTTPTTANPVSMGQLRMMLEKSARKGVLSQDENLLLLEILELSMLKLRHLMTPRVEVYACSVKTDLIQMLAMMRMHQLRYIAVYKDSIDSIFGLVYLRDLLQHPRQESVENLVHPVAFVPEQKTVESLIEFFQKTKSDIAVVVDEYGGVAGMISQDDIVNQLLGTENHDLDAQPIQQVGPMTYRLAAQLSIHDWAEAFGVDPEELRMTTLGGLVTALLGRIPKSGDVAHWQNMRFTVESVRKNRIESLILSLEPLVPKP
jgi:CBS domain containing-hemolysin-like protein